MKYYGKAELDSIIDSILKTQKKDSSMKSGKWAGILIDRERGRLLLTDKYRLLIVDSLPVYTSPEMRDTTDLSGILRVVPDESDLHPPLDLIGAENLPKVSAVGKLFLSLDMTGYSDPESAQDGPISLCPIWLGIYPDRWNFDAAFVPPGWQVQLNRKKTYPSVFVGQGARLIVMPVTG